MRPRFSLVYPTRHRPAFLAEALSALELQTGRDFEVIVSDNFIDPAQSCETICSEASSLNLKYVRPPEPVGMVANWNYAAQHATGDYVALFTDKMLLLPDALARVSRVLDSGIPAMEQPDIISWVSDGYKPSRYPGYFGGGVYTAVQADSASNGPAHVYRPIDALNEKGNGLRSRYEQSPSQYCRGKIVFGAYHRSLIERIKQAHGQLFHDISPDYTSMILGLSIAQSAVELKSSAVVSITTDVSNGMLGSIHDQHALGYLRSLAENPEALFRNMLVPGMYAAQHNVVSHDYLSLKNQFNLDFTFNTLNWLVYCIEDLSKSDRVWSSAAIEQAQMQLMYSFMGSLSADKQNEVVNRLESRLADRNAGRSVPTAAGQILTWNSPSLRQAMQRRSSWS